MAFIDADKVSYPFYYERVMDILRTGGLIAMDSMLQGGTVLSPRTRVQGGSMRLTVGSRRISRWRR